jgi:hypothetical protein
LFEPLTGFESLLEQAGVEFCLVDFVLHNSIYRADDELPGQRTRLRMPSVPCTVLHVRRAHDGGMVATNLDAFERGVVGAATELRLRRHNRERPDPTLFA